MRVHANRRVDLAVRALRLLAEEGQRSGRELAGRLGTSVAFLGQVLAPLIRAGWLRSFPGPGGGYRLVVSPHLSLLELVETLEGPLDDGTCVFRGGTCRPTNPCVLHDVAERTRRAAYDELAAAQVFLPRQSQPNGSAPAAAVPADPYHPTRSPRRHQS